MCPVRQVHAILCRKIPLPVAPPRVIFMGFDFGSALAALEANDGDAFLEVCKGAPAVSINAKVTSDLKLGTVPISKALEPESGDTMLHLAMRTRKWNCRKVLVADLGADATLTNAAGETVRVRTFSFPSIRERNKLPTHSKLTNLPRVLCVRSVDRSRRACRCVNPACASGRH